MESVLHIIRHGITEGNQKNWHYGSSDIPLAEEGIDNIRNLKLLQVYPDINGGFFTSGMLRTNQTLNLIYGDVDKKYVRNLREINFGEFEKKTHEELKDDERYVRWIEDEIGNVKLPNGESKTEFQERVISGFMELLDNHRLSELKYRHGDIVANSLCVCHGGVIGAIMSKVFEREQRHFVEWIPRPARGFTLYINNGKAVEYKELEENGYVYAEKGEVMKIFIVEDDRGLRKQLKTFLEKYGYSCLYSDDFQNIEERISESNADMVLLDVNLPYKDGYCICRYIRKQSDIPVIMVTSRDTDMDELMSLNLGADDFITKPFNTQILLAHINAIFKRLNKRENPEVREYKGLSYYPEKGIAVHDDNEVELTKNENKILQIMLSKKGKIVSRDEIINEMWQSDEFIDDNTLTVNVNRLRKKLGEIGLHDYISTKRGQGYIV